MKARKKAAFIWLTFLLWAIVFKHGAAQKNDYIWITNGGSNLHNVEPQDSLAGNLKMDFNYNPVQTSFDSINLNFDADDVSMSDSSGNLLFYCNGVSVYNWTNQLMENGDSINAGYIIDVWDTGLQYFGLQFGQGVSALPNPANPAQYYLLHSFCDSIPGTGGNHNYAKSTLNTLIDMSENGGLGKVIYKNRTLFTSDSGVNEALTATRHANGRDWWLIEQKRNTNCFYSMLLDPSGFHIMDSVCTGFIQPVHYVSDHMCFSPDGSKFTFMCLESGLSIFDFDRCTGALSNLRQIAIDSFCDSIQYFYAYGQIMGMAISPNSRFLYLSLSERLYQLDLWSDSIFAHIDTVGVYDGWYLYDNLSGSYFSNCQLGPDGIIFISSTPSEIPYYHVIYTPDDSGLFCDFIQRGLHLPVSETGVPNFPNYRLGALPGPCDTISGLNEVQRAAKEKILKIYPNPAADYAIIDYGFTDWSKGAVQLQICNALGQTMPIGRQAVYSQQLPMYSGFQKIDVSNFASGMYTIFIKRNNAIVSSGKVVKE